MRVALPSLLFLGTCWQFAAITEITDQTLERTLQDADPWVIQFGDKSNPLVQKSLEALEALEKTMHGFLNIGFYPIKDAASLRLATYLNLPSLNDVYFFNTKHNITETPENTWVFALPVASPVRFNVDVNEPSPENIEKWATENIPTRTVSLSTMCLEPCIAFPDTAGAVTSLSGNTVVFTEQPTPQLMLLAAKYRHVASFVSLGNSTSLRNALPGGPTMPTDTACVVMGPGIQPPKVFTGASDAWRTELVEMLEHFPVRSAPAKEINRRRRIATMAALQSNVTEIGDHEAFTRHATPPLNMGGLAIAFFAPSMEEQHARYTKHFNALATKYSALAAEKKGQQMPMQFFHINAEAHPGIARHLGVEKIPSLVCLLPASENRAAQTYHDGKFETEPMFKFMRDKMMSDQDRMREYSPPADISEKFSSSGPKSYPTEMPACPPCDAAVLRNGLFYAAKNAPRAEIHIDTSQSKKYLNVEAEKERQRIKKEAREARMKNRAKGNKKSKKEEL